MPNAVLAATTLVISDKLFEACKAVSANKPCAAVAKAVASCKAVSAKAPCAAVA